MCPKCQEVGEKTRFHESTEYLDFMFQLGGFVADGTFLLLEEPTHQQVSDSGTVASDIVVHLLECTCCRQRFRLTAPRRHELAAWELDVKDGRRLFQ